ncbi:hypothetical protein CALVIDRAFT_563716 [Calocera viscosa TUFC12733]|uniref:Uncharacterized protein n=1 Tax=Calocera viscosa (strain TUFC12733) TaxID=1330018 RepID=A0A167MEP6_CALVF|nr:hypothetical protein CALVIDRAFT_563716 [Calocera viscosa TUFC12733]
MPSRPALSKSKASRTVRPIKSTAGRTARVAKSTRFDVDGDEDMDKEDYDEVEEEEDGIDESAMQMILAAKKRSAANKVNLNSAVARNNQATINALAEDRNAAEKEIRDMLDFVVSVLDSEPPDTLNPMLDLIGARNKEAEAVQALYANVIDAVAANKNMVLEATEQLLHDQSKERAKSYKKTIRRAQEALNEGIGNQKAAADPTELIKHLIRAVAA